jgi:uncharacterized protein (DUF927 family)
MSNSETYTIRKIARIHDKATEKYLEVIEFPISKFEIKRVELLPSVVSELKAFGKALRDAGAILPKNRDKLKQLLMAVADSDAPEEWAYETRTGWTQDRQAFVLVNGVIGNPETKIVGVIRFGEPGDRSGKLSMAGTWKSWRSSVAMPARLSTTLMFSLSVAFAAPLLTVTNRQSFAINLFGQSRSGKSIATLMSASLIGAARIADLISWNVTDAGLQERLAEFNDMVFPIEELATMREKNQQKYLRIRNLAYTIAHGSPTTLHSSFSESHGGEQQPWRSIALTSNEQSVRDLAQAERQERQHGEALRLIDVPVVFDGLDHIFDRVPTDSDTSNFQDWKRRTFKKIADACELNHGRAFRKYIKALIAHHSELKTAVEEWISFFVNKVCDEFDGDVARDVAEKFGLIFAGGMLGIQYKLLPWEETELLDAVAKSYVAARALLPDDGVSRRQGITALRAKLRELTRVSKKAAAEIDFDEIEGYRKRRKKVNKYVIKCDAFNSIFVSRTQRSLVIEWLIQKQRITLATAKASAGAPAPKPKKQHSWPDGERRRSFEIVWPRKRKAAKKAAAMKAE